MPEEPMREKDIRKATEAFLRRAGYEEEAARFGKPISGVIPGAPEVVSTEPTAEEKVRLPKDKEQLIYEFRKRMRVVIDRGGSELKGEDVAKEIGLVVGEAAKVFVSEVPEIKVQIDGQEKDVRELLYAEIAARVSIKKAYLDRLEIGGDYVKRVRKIEDGKMTHIELDDYMTIAAWEKLGGSSQELLEKMERAIQVYVAFGDNTVMDVVTNKDLFKGLEFEHQDPEITAPGNKVKDSNFFVLPVKPVGAVSSIRGAVRQELGGDEIAQDAENLAWQLIEANDIPNYFMRGGAFMGDITRLTAFAEWREFRAKQRSDTVGSMRLLAESNLPGAKRSEKVAGVFVNSIPRLARVTLDYIQCRRRDPQTGQETVLEGLDLARQGRLFRGADWKSLEKSPHKAANASVMAGHNILELLMKMKELKIPYEINADYFGRWSGGLWALLPVGVLKKIDEIKDAKLEIAKDIFWEFSPLNPRTMIAGPDGKGRWVGPKTLDSWFNDLFTSSDPVVGKFFTNEPDDQKRLEELKRYFVKVRASSQKTMLKFSFLQGFVQAARAKMAGGK